MPRRPSPKTRACRAARALSRSFIPAFILAVVVVLIEVVIVVEIVFVVLFIVVVDDVQLERRHADHLEVRAALGAAQLIAFVDVELVDFDLAVTFRAGGHTSPRYYARRRPAHSVWQLGTGRARIRTAGAIAIRAEL